MIHDFGLHEPERIQNQHCRKGDFESFFQNLARRNGERRLNSLVINAGPVGELSSSGRMQCYSKQIAAPFSLEYMEQALRSNPAITAKIVRLFETL